MASHDSGSTISAISTIANSHSTGWVQSMRGLGEAMLEVRVMLKLSLCHSGAREARARNPYSRWWLWIPGLRLTAHPGMTMVVSGAKSHPKQLGIARLDLFAHRLDPGRIFLHQLDLGDLPPSRLRFDLRMRRILRGEIDEELLGLPRVQPDQDA